MNAEKYTQKSLEAVKAAQELTIQNQNQQIEQVHLLAALLRQDGGLVPQLMKKMGVTVESLDAAVSKELEKLPRVTGSGREADRFYVSRAVDNALNRADAAEKQRLLALLADSEMPAGEKIAAVTHIYDALGISQLTLQTIDNLYKEPLAALDALSLPAERIAPLRQYAGSLLGRKS